MTKRKWAYTIILVFLVGAVLFFYNAFNGNPISKMTAEKNLGNYLERTYPDDEFIIQRSFYNFKVGGYNFVITKVGGDQQTEYEFILTGFFGLHVHYDGIYYANQDEKLLAKLAKEANEELTKFLQRKVPEVLEVNVQMELLKEKYPPETTWSKDFKPEKPMYVHIGVDSREFSDEDFLEVTRIIQKSLNEAAYNYEDVMINGNIIDNSFEEGNGENNWYVKYVVPFEKDTKLKLSDIKHHE